jgi:RNA polymerase sigma-70 factor (ECF subfamily)
VTERAAFGRAFEEHRAFLWSLLYRLTGNAADADDLVQETFVRALRRPPARPADPWRPWLVTVALNLGRDLLRRRRRRAYPGIWLPSPIETSEPPPPEPVDPRGDPSGRYDLLETVSFAFLLALEALSPAQRAVLLLRDVFDYSVRETGRALALTEASVKTTHLRARRRMQAYDRARTPRRPEAGARTGEALARFLETLARGDAPALEALLAEDVRSSADGGGEFAASPVGIVGRAAVGRLYLGLGRRLTSAGRVSIVHVNGLPALAVEQEEVPKGWPPRAILRAELDEAGRIRAIYTVAATRKLRGLFPSLREPGAPGWREPPGPTPP